MQVVAEKFHKAVPEAFLGHGVAFLQVVYKHPQSPGTPGQCWGSNLGLRNWRSDFRVALGVATLHYVFATSYRGRNFCPVTARLIIAGSAAVTR